MTSWINENVIHTHSLRSELNKFTFVIIFAPNEFVLRYLINEHILSCIKDKVFIHHTHRTDQNGYTPSRPCHSICSIFRTCHQGIRSSANTARQNRLNECVYMCIEIGLNLLLNQCEQFRQLCNQIVGGVKPRPLPGRWRFALFCSVVSGPHWLTFYIKPQQSIKKVASELATTAKSAIAAMDTFKCQYYEKFCFLSTLETP